MVSITTVISALCLAITTSAAPTESDTRAAAAFTGSVTYYEVGLGACGQTNSDSELVVAVSHSLYDREHPCGRNIRVHYEGKSVDVRVVDRCKAVLKMTWTSLLRLSNKSLVHSVLAAPQPPGSGFE